MDNPPPPSIDRERHLKNANGVGIGGGCCSRRFALTVGRGQGDHRGARESCSSWGVAEVFPVGREQRAHRGAWPRCSSLVFIIGVHCGVWALCLVLLPVYHTTVRAHLYCSVLRPSDYTAVNNRGWSRLTLLPPVSGVWSSRGPKRYGAMGAEGRVAGVERSVTPEN